MLSSAVMVRSPVVTGWEGTNEQSDDGTAQCGPDRSVGAAVAARGDGVVHVAHEAGPVEDGQPRCLVDAAGVGGQVTALEEDGADVGRALDGLDRDVDHLPAEEL